MSCSSIRRLLTGNGTREFEDYYMLYRAAYNRLSQEALEWGVTRWPMRPKDHYYEHATFDFTGSSGFILNMRFFSNYQNEDLMRRVKQLAIKSHQTCLSKHVVFKYTLQFTLPFRDR